MEYEIRISKGTRLIKLVMTLFAAVFLAAGLAISVVGMYISIGLIILVLLIPQKQTIEEIMEQPLQKRMVEINKISEIGESAKDIELERLKKELEEMKAAQDLPPEPPRQKQGFVCRWCNQEFQNKRNLNMHIISKHEAELGNL